MVLGTLESAAARFARDWLNQRDDRKSRGYDKMSPITGERKNREYVNRATGVAAWSLVPANTVAPAVTGTAQVAQVLTTTDGTWTNTPVTSRQWLRNGVAISGATGTTYTVVAADVGSNLSVKVTAVKAGYPDQYAYSNATATVIA